MALIQWSNPEIKAKITGKNNGMYGRNHTDETRNKIREKALGRPSAIKLNISVLCVELNRVFEYVSDASKEFNLTTTNIIRVCKGERNTCGGYHWEFYNLEK